MPAESQFSGWKRGKYLGFLAGLDNAGHCVLFVVLFGCSSSTGKLPVASLFASSSEAGSTYETVTEESPSPTEDSAAIDGLPEDPPWPTDGDGVDAGGDMDCPDLLTPCNHAVRLAVRDEAGAFWPMDGPLAIRASVPDVMIVDHGVLDGRHWRSLWLTWVDVDPSHIPAEANAENILTTAVLAFPDDLVTDAAAFLDLLHGAGPYDWVRQRTDTWKQGYRIVDPDREVFSDGDTVQHALLVIDLDLESAPESVQNHFYVLTSNDGFSFERGAELVSDRIGTDPDCYPLGSADFPAPDQYPSVLPFSQSLAGDGRWACNVAGYQQFTRYEGTLARQAETGEGARGITVTSTTIVDGVRHVWGHVDADPPTTAGQVDFVHTIAYDDGSYAPVDLVVDADDLPGGEHGIHAPTLLRIGSGIELLVYHTLLEPPGVH